MSSLLLALLAAGDAGPLHDPFAGGHVDWTRGVLVAQSSSSRGAGLMTSRRTLEQEAWLRLEGHMVQQAGEIRVSSDLQARDLLEAQDSLARRLQEGLQNWRVTTTRYRRSGQVELEAELDLGEWLRPALMAWGSQDSVGSPGHGTTGLVVDARGHNTVPSLVPRLLSPTGDVLFGPENLGAEYLEERATVTWVTDPADPEASLKGGSAPLVLAVQRVENGSELVLGPTDSKMLWAAGLPWNRGGIVVVVDP